MECGVGFERDQDDDGFGGVARQDTSHDAAGVIDGTFGLQPGTIDDVEYGGVDGNDAARFEFHVGVVDGGRRLDKRFWDGE